MIAGNFASRRLWTAAMAAGIGLAAAPTWAQNPFAPQTPAAAGAASPTAGQPAEPAAPSANPFAPTTPAAPTPTATPAAPAAPATNPFAPAAPTPSTPMPTAPAAGAAPPAAGAPTTVGVPATQPPAGGYRVLAPGVLTTIPSPVMQADKTSRHDIIEILAESPTFGERPNTAGKSPLKNVHFKHDVWGLEFAFKPVRFIRLKDAAGKERLIWYLVYFVKNGPYKGIDDKNLENVPPGELPAQLPVTKPFLFIPHFELESHDVQKRYPERILPEAVAAIQAREDKNRKLLNTAEITGEIPPTTPEAERQVWGVATWEGVDPRTDRFSIFVHGLTNVYRWEDAPGAYQKGDPVGKGRTYQYQVLKLNFWRPSDTQFQHEEEIRFGIPGDVDYEWLYQ